MKSYPEKSHNWTHDLPQIPHNYYYFSFKIFLRFWLAKILGIIYLNQILPTIFGRILRYVKNDVKCAAKLSDFCSLHDRRFMSQAGQTRYFARSTTRARSARRGKEKNKAPVRSPLFLQFRPLTPTNINYPRWCQKNQSKHDPLSRENCHLSGAKRLHCSRNEELRLFPWLRELLPKFTGLNHLILYVGQC